MAGDLRTGTCVRYESCWDAICFNHSSGCEIGTIHNQQTCLSSELIFVVSYHPYSILRRAVDIEVLVNFFSRRKVSNSTPLAIATNIFEVLLSGDGAWVLCEANACKCFLN